MTTKDESAVWVENLMRDFQDRLTCGLYEAIYSLERPAVECLMHAQARTCVGGFLDLSGLRVPMELDEFLRVIRTVAPSQIDIERHGERIEWIERHQGQCICPFVRRAVVRLDPKLCLCGAHWVQVLFEVAARTRVHVETVSTVADSAQDCHFRITLLGPSNRE